MQRHMTSTGEEHNARVQCLRLFIFLGGLCLEFLNRHTWYQIMCCVVPHALLVFRLLSRIIDPADGKSCLLYHTRWKYI